MLSRGSFENKFLFKSFVMKKHTCKKDNNLNSEKKIDEYLFFH
jgi:hypothetical protein